MSYSVREDTANYVGSDGRRYFPNMTVPRGVRLRRADPITDAAFQRAVDVTRSPRSHGDTDRGVGTGAEWARRVLGKSTPAPDAARNSRSETGAEWAGRLCKPSLSKLRDDEEADEMAARIERWKKLTGKK